MPLPNSGPRWPTHRASVASPRINDRIFAYLLKATAASGEYLMILIRLPFPVTIAAAFVRSRSDTRSPATSASRAPLLANNVMIALSLMSVSFLLLHVASSFLSTSSPTSGTSFCGTAGGCMPAIGFGMSSSSASQRKHCCKLLNWLLQ